METSIDKVKEAVNYGTTKATETFNNVAADIQKVAADNNIHSPLPSDFLSEVQKAADILASFTDPEKTEGGLDNVIPIEVIRKAKGLVIFTVLKAGLFWSGRAGSGLVVARTDDGKWSPPSCINVAGLGFGAQFGADVTDFVIVLNTPEAVKAFSRGENVTLGGNLSVSVGPIGKSAELSGSFYERAPLYSYCKSKGFFAGISVEGTIIIERRDANKKFYNKDLSAAELLSGKAEVSPISTNNVLYEVIKRAEERPEKKETTTNGTQ